MITQDEQAPDHLAKRVLGRITDEHLMPRPRWKFLLRNYIFWGLGIIAILLGALAFSATLFEVQNADWRLFPAMHMDLISFFFATAPFVWVFALALFIFVGYIYIRRTVHGYRYPLTTIAIGAVLLAFLLGNGLYAMGFGGEVEEAIGDHPPFYRPILVEERSWWLASQKGLLGGEVERVSPRFTSFVLRDFSGRVWDVDTSDLRNRDLVTVARGGVVRVIGVPATSTSSIFHACFVFPWITAGVPQDEPMPPPLAVIASTSGKSAAEQSSACKDIRPYNQLSQVEDTW
ncbi:hypothetical protein HKL94_00440 [Candidatus Parcubacteria bacterium]|nr:hypothetical protein [Candidatus Parcubacteria bacterium]